MLSRSSVLRSFSCQICLVDPDCRSRKYEQVTQFLVVGLWNINELNFATLHVNDTVDCVRSAKGSVLNPDAGWTFHGIHASRVLCSLSHIANGRLGYARNSSVPKMLPEGEWTRPALALDGFLGSRPDLGRVGATL